MLNNLKAMYMKIGIETYDYVSNSGLLRLLVYLLIIIDET